MPWGAGAYVQFYPETTYGAFPAIDPLTTLTFEITGDDTLKLRKVPLFADIRTANKGNRKARRVSHRHNVRGTLTTWLYPTQTQAVLDWALKLTSGDTASYSAQTFNTIVQEQWLGIKVKKLTLAAAADQQEGEVKATLELWGQTQGSTPSAWTAPADSTYPNEDAWALTDTPGHLELGTSAGTTRTKYKDFTVEFDNVLDATFDETAYIRTCNYAGRDVTFSFTPQFVDHTDLDNWIAQSSLFSKLGFVKGAKALTFDFKSLNKIDSFDYMLPLAARSYSPIKLANFIDHTNADDFTYTVALS